MAKFEKGHKKLGGRKKGATNKISTEVKELIAFALNENRDKFIEELNSLSGKDFCTVYVAISEFVAPKLKRVSLESEQGFTVNVVDYAPKLNINKENTNEQS